MKWGGNYRKLHGTRVRMLLAAPGALKRVTSLPTTVAGPGAAATQDHSSKTIAPDTVSTEAEMLLIFQTATQILSIVCKMYHIFVGLLHYTAAVVVATPGAFRHIPAHI